MTFKPDSIGSGEARLRAILSLMTAPQKLADLNAFLSLSPPVLPVLSVGAGRSQAVPVTSAQFTLGDPEVLPDAKTRPFWVSVVGGGERDGQDMEIAQIQSHGGDRITAATNIYFYLHPDAFPISDAWEQAGLREGLRARFADWLRSDVLGNFASRSILMTSQEFGSPDHLDESYIRSVVNGYVLKGFGSSQWVYMAHFLHQGVIYAGG